LVIQVERAQKASRGSNLISSKDTVNMIMYVQIDSLKYRFCWMHTRPSHTLCRPLSQVSQLHVIVPGMGHSDKRTPLLRPSRAITGIFGEIGKSGEHVRALRESRNISSIPHLAGGWLIKRPISHPCLTSTYQLILH